VASSAPANPIHAFIFAILIKGISCSSVTKLTDFAKATGHVW